MAAIRLDLRRVAVIGAGVSGVSAAVHLKRAGLDVTVYERSSRAGGIWVFDERTSRDPAYPSTVPSVGDSPEFEWYKERRQDRHDSPLRELANGHDAEQKPEDLSLSFAPPGPCYIALKNNVSTTEMELTCQKWKPGTEEFVPHHVLGDYIQDTAIANGLSDVFSFNTRVNQVDREGNKWRIDISSLLEDGQSIANGVELFDGVVVASGHYHACNIPEIPGLAEWKRNYPDRVQHSKLYRRPESFKDQTVLIIGAGVSSMDIARDLGPHARAVYQSSRGGPYDLPSHMLPDNGARIGGIESFGNLDLEKSAATEGIPGIITLRTGEQLCGVDRVIVATGYHVSLPFMRQYHADGVRPEDADETVLVTNGQQTHNLHADIWYISEPTLSFIGVPYHVATFSCFEFQAMALAAVFSGKAQLPSESNMRSEYEQRILRKGAGRTFHSLKGRGDEIAYVKELAEAFNDGSKLIAGHSENWLQAYARRCIRQQAVLSQVRDPKLDEYATGLIAGC